MKPRTPTSREPRSVGECEPTRRLRSLPVGGQPRPFGAASASALAAGVERLLGHRFETSLAPLFQRLTGHHLEMVWRQESPPRPHPRGGPACPSARARLLRRGTLSAVCRGCPCSRSLAVGFRSPERSIRGNCGALNFADDVRVGNQILATLVFQVRPHDPTRQPVAGACPAGLAQGLLEIVQHDLQETAWHWQLEREAGGPVQATEVPLERLPRAESTTLPTTRPTALLPELPPTVASMLEYLGHNYSHPITLKGLAGVLGRNPSYLSDLFTRSVGCSFRRRLASLRLAKAQELLADRSLPIQAIAQAVGFTEPHEFRWAFKHWTGSTATQWRAKRAPSA